MTLVKICGITNAADAAAVVDAGADMLGFNFYRKSPRFILAEDAKMIVCQLPASAKPVAVFVNEPLDSLIEILRVALIKCVQLHGDETPQYVDQLKSKCSVKVIKAFRVASGASFANIEEFHADAVLLDAFTVDEFGGTGNTFDWKLASELQGKVPKLFLAGGLNPLNVVEAIRQVRPFAVDVASGVESSPGIKDPEKVKALIEAAHKAI